MACTVCNVVQPQQVFALTHWGRDKITPIFKLISFKRILLNFDENFAEVCSEGSILQ